MRSQSILVVDDDPDMRNALFFSLRKGGYAVEAVSNGVEALDRFGQRPFNMVITDVKMPEMNGMELLGRVKKLSPQVPVIMMSGFGTVDSAVEAMKQGASDYIMKPFSWEALEGTIGKVSSASTSTSPQVRRCFDTGDGEEGKVIVSRDPLMGDVMSLAESVADSDATVLILGESGTGKELLAQYIHRNSGRRDKPYVAINCAALPEHLAESELFGHERGSFTGAVSRKAGKFELAAQGTLVLDEISEMSLPLQAKLLRVLQEREIDRVGGTRPIPVDARIIAISNVDLKEAVQNGSFRKDLYYRVNVFPVTVPALRDRPGDITVLAEYFLEKYASRNGKKTFGIDDDALALLLAHDWKGNVRELENTMERAVLLSRSETLTPRDVVLDRAGCPAEPRGEVEVGLSVREMEKRLILKTLEKMDGNRTHASKLLDISIRTLRNKLKEYREQDNLIVP